MIANVYENAEVSFMASLNRRRQYTQNSKHEPGIPLKEQLLALLNCGVFLTPLSSLNIAVIVQMLFLWMIIQFLIIYKYFWHAFKRLGNNILSGQPSCLISTKEIFCGNN